MPGAMRLPVTCETLLAPMEGVTEPAYRGLVLARNDAASLGGATTEFLRVLQRPRRGREIERHLEGPSYGRPIGLQMMGSDLESLAGSASNAVESGAAWVDLNFGCPAKGALRGCAGSALLGDLNTLSEVVRVTADAVKGRVPVTAKIRAGIDDAESVEEIARAAEAGGADLLTIHCRTRSEGYQPEVDWSRIRRAVEAVSIPVCGNGGVRKHADIERMRDATGCAYVMVGQAALGDPWVFSGTEVDRAEAAQFHLEYIEKLQGQGAQLRGAIARVKQLLRHWTAGDLVPPDERLDWLREKEPAALRDRLAAIAGARTR